jgi:hypothetical protein
MGCGGSKPCGTRSAGNTMKEGIYTIVSVSSGLAFEEEFLCSPADTDNQRYEIRQHGDSGEVWTCQQVSSRGFFAMDMGVKEGDILHCRGKDPSEGDHLHWRFLPASDGTFFIQSVENDSYLHGKNAAAKNGQVGAVQTLDKSDPGFQWRILRQVSASLYSPATYCHLANDGSLGASAEPAPYTLEFEGPPGDGVKFRLRTPDGRYLRSDGMEGQPPQLSLVTDASTTVWILRATGDPFSSPVQLKSPHGDRGLPNHQCVCNDQPTGGWGGAVKGKWSWCPEGRGDAYWKLVICDGSKPEDARDEIREPLMQLTVDERAVQESTLRALPSGAAAGPVPGFDAPDFTMEDGRRCLAFHGTERLSLSAEELPHGNASYEVEVTFKRKPGQYQGFPWMVVLIHGNEGQNNGVSGIGIHQSDDHVSHFWWSNDLAPPGKGAHNGWMTVRVTWNGTTRKFYLDGSLIAEDQAEGQRHDVSAGSQLVLGGLVREFGGEHNHLGFHGWISEVKISTIARVDLSTEDGLRRCREAECVQVREIEARLGGYPARLEADRRRLQADRKRLEEALEEDHRKRVEADRERLEAARKRVQETEAQLAALASQAEQEMLVERPGFTRKLSSFLFGEQEPGAEPIVEGVVVETEPER